MKNKYRVKKLFYLQEIAGEYVVIARGPYALQFGGVLVLNESCLLLWKKMKEYCTSEELYEELMEQYGIEEQVAKVDVDTCIRKMLEYGLLDIEQ